MPHTITNTNPNPNLNPNLGKTSALHFDT